MAPSSPFLASLRALGKSRLADWLVSAPGGFAAPAKLRVRAFPAMGLGLEAAAPLAAGETVLRVPRGVWQPFSAEHALSHMRTRAPPFAQRVDGLAAQMATHGVAGAAKLPLHVALALHLLFEAANPAAAGHAYAAALPTPDAPALWPAADVAALLGTRTHAATAGRAAFVSTVHASLFGEGGGGGVTRERFGSALAVVLSRALSGTSAPYSLVPILDIANHAAVPTCEHAFDAAQGAFELRTLRPHAEGEQLLLCYGRELCNDRTLRLYGFTTPCNAHDAVLLPPPWPRAAADDPLGSLKRRLLHRADVAPLAAAADVASSAAWWWSADADAAPVPVRGAADAEALLCALRVMFAAPADVPSADVAVLDASRPLSERNEAQARGALAAAARAALRRYPSTLAETEAALAAGDAPPRLAAALTVRAGEQRALQSLLQAAEQPAGGEASAASDFDSKADSAAAACAALRAAGLTR